MPWAQLLLLMWLQVVNVLGFSLPQYKSPTLLLSLGLSVRVLWQLIMRRSGQQVHAAAGTSHAALPADLSEASASSTAVCSPTSTCNCRRAVSSECTEVLDASTSSVPVQTHAWATQLLS